MPKTNEKAQFQTEIGLLAPPVGLEPTTTRLTDVKEGKTLVFASFYNYVIKAVERGTRLVRDLKRQVRRQARTSALSACNIVVKNSDVETLSPALKKVTSRSDQRKNAFERRKTG